MTDEVTPVDVRAPAKRDRAALQTIGHYAPNITIALVAATVVWSAIGLWYRSEALTAIYLLVVTLGSALILAGRRAHRGNMCRLDRPSGREHTDPEKRSLRRHGNRRALNIGNASGVVITLAALIAALSIRPENTGAKMVLTAALLVGGFLFVRLDLDALSYQRATARRQRGAIGGS